MRKSWAFLLGLFAVLAIAFPAYAVYGETPVASNPFDQVNVSISGQTVVWQDYRNKTSGCPTGQNCLAADIYAADLAGNEQKLTATPNGKDPDIDNNIVAWRDWSTGKIIVHNLTNGTQINASLMGGAVQMVTPAVSGQKVVWVDYRNSGDYGDIYMRDLGQPADVPVSLASDIPGLANAQKDKRNPDIHGNIVVWEDWRDAYQDAQGWWHNPNIYMKDLSTNTEQAVTTNLSDQYSPAVYGNKVFWQDYRNGNWDIYMKELPNGEEIRVTNNSAHQSWPAVNGDLLTWKDTRSGNEDIYMQRLSTGAEAVVTANTALQKLPAVSGNTLAWMDNRSGDWDVYIAKVDETPPAVDSVGPSGWLNGNSANIIATYSDEGEGVDPSTVVVRLDGAPMPGCTVNASQADCPASGLLEGHHAITVDLSDLAGNAASQGVGSFDVDTQGPLIGPMVFNNPPNSDTASIDADISDGSGSGLNLSMVSMRVDGTLLAGCTVTTGHITCTETGLTIGVHQVQIDATDNLGNPSVLIDSFQTLDTVAPIIANAAPVGELSSAATVISADYSDPYPASGINTAAVSVTLDGTPLTGCIVTSTGVDCTVSGLANGLHNLVVSVDDFSGNAGSHGWSFTVAAPGPGITNLQPAPGGIVNNAWVVVSADLIDNGRGVDVASIRVYLDGVDITAKAAVSTGSIQYQIVPGVNPGFTDGAHTALVAAADMDGQVSQQAWSFTITSPQLQLFHVRTYWPSYADYVQGQLMVDYRMQNLGTGSCLSGEVSDGRATGGVISYGPLPVNLGDIAPQGSIDYGIMYVISPGVGSFIATTYARCLNDGGNIYWFPGAPPS